MVIAFGRRALRRSCALGLRPLARRRSTSSPSAPATRRALASAQTNAYPALLQALLRKKGINANVTNAGVNGDVTSGMLRRHRRRRAQGHRPRHPAARRQRSALLRHQGGAHRQCRRHGGAGCARATSASSSTIRIRCRRTSTNGTTSTLTPPRMPRSPRRWRRKSLAQVKARRSRHRRPRPALPRLPRRQLQRRPLPAPKAV